MQAYFIVPVAMFAIISSVFLIILPTFQKPVPTLLAMTVILLGVPVYILFVMETPWRLRPKILDNLSSKLGVVSYSLVPYYQYCQKSMGASTCRCVLCLLIKELAIPIGCCTIAVQ